MSPKRSRAEWEQLVAELEDSGETIGRFASARGVNRNTLAWWRWRTRSSPDSAHRVDFVPVVVDGLRAAHAVGAVRLEAELPNGVVVRFGDGLELAQLREVVSALAGA